MSDPVFLGLPTAPPGVGHLRGRRPFPEAARTALGDAQLRRNLAKATGTIRAKRAAVVGEVPDWAELRAGVRTVHLAEILASTRDEQPEVSAR